jgi:hypothetical protein
MLKGIPSRSQLLKSSISDEVRAAVQHCPLPSALSHLLTPLNNPLGTLQKTSCIQISISESVSQET